MYFNSKFQPKSISLIVSLLFSTAAYADNDTEARLAELQKQMQALNQELQAVQQQLAQTKEAKIAEKGKSSGSPVYASFKDGLVFDDGSSNWRLQINGRVQADYRTYDPTEWKDDTLSIRRARFGGTFSFLKDFAVRVEGEYANDNAGARGTTALTYGYIDFTRWSAAKIRAGQFKPFFGIERAASTNFIDFAELSLATNNGTIFTSTYDRGVMVFGDPMPWMNYNAYVVNGTGQNNDDVNDRKDTGGRINANFAKLAELDNTVIHAGASVSKGNFSTSNTATNAIRQTTEANGVEFFSVAGLGFGAKADRKRWGAETALAKGPVKFQAEYILSNFSAGRLSPAGSMFTSLALQECQESID